MIAQLVAHRHLAAIITLITTLVACDGKGVDVSVVGIPADTQVTVSVDSLRQDIAAAPSKVYRYKGVGYARLLGLAAAPSYTATARRLDGCTVAVGSVEYNGEDEVRIDLHAVDGCGKPALDALYLTTHLHNMFGEKSAYISDIVERLVQSAGSPKATTKTTTFRKFLIVDAPGFLAGGLL